MKYRRLGKSDLEVSVIALGCWQFAGGPNWGNQEERNSIEAVHTALDCGINLFDTAQAYGDGVSEEILGKALLGRRGEAIIATKPSSDSLDDLRLACEAALRRLRTDRIDIYQMHWRPKKRPLVDVISDMIALREAGMIRAVAVCNLGPGDIRELEDAGIEMPVSNQLPYSLLWRAVEFEVCERTVAAGMGILCYSPLMQGLLTGRYTDASQFPEGRARSRHFSSSRPDVRHGEAGHEEETFEAIRAVQGVCDDLGMPMRDVAIAWLLAREGVASILAGARDAGQVMGNAASAEVSISPDAVAELERATQPLKAAMGPNPDMWSAVSRFR